MAKLLTDSEFQRFSELQQKQASFTITTEEADELRDIVARAQQKRDDRAAAMQAMEAYIQQFDISPDELFSPEQIGDAARTYGLIPAAKKERVLPPSFTYNGKPYQWTRASRTTLRATYLRRWRPSHVRVARWLPRNAGRPSASR
jgi:hypothetical protein